MAWLRLSTNTLSSTNTNISTGAITAKKFLFGISNLINQAGIASAVREQMNNDTSSNYAVRRSINGAVDSTATSATEIDCGVGVALDRLVICYTINIATEEKLQIYFETGNDVTGAGTAPYRVEQTPKWVNTSDQITEIDFNTSGSGIWQIGTNVMIMGTE